MSLAVPVAEDIATSFFDLIPGLHEVLRQGTGGKPHLDSLRPAGPDVPGQIRVMRLLRRHGPQTMQELATATEVSAPTVSGIVKRLAAQGIVSRATHTRDGRVTVIDLTPEGRAAMDAFRQSRIDALRARLDALDGDDREAIRRALPALQRLFDMKGTL
jgi:DNA-binding MarR family transcriptional regulator